MSVGKLWRVSYHSLLTMQNHLTKKNHKTLKLRYIQLYAKHLNILRLSQFIILFLDLG